jgi:nitrate reductase NapE component
MEKYVTMKYQNMRTSLTNQRNYLVIMLGKWDIISVTFAVTYGLKVFKFKPEIYKHKMYMYVPCA